MVTDTVHGAQTGEEGLHSRLLMNVRTLCPKRTGRFPSPLVRERKDVPQATSLTLTHTILDQGKREKTFTGFASLEASDTDAGPEDLKASVQ